MLLVIRQVLTRSYTSKNRTFFKAISHNRTHEDVRRYRSSDSKPKKPEQAHESHVVTTATGAPISEKNASLTVGPTGHMLLQDTHFIEELAHFDRERIPERVVHAKGAGAFGYFQVTHDITKYCAAKVFDTVGKKTKIAVRFSTVAGELGSADTVRDPRGFAIKFYTDDGIWDLVGNNTPVFFIRDPILFPSLVHSHKRHPATHLHDPDMFWDFASLRPETTHQLMILFGDRGIPDGYRFMNGYGGHAFKMINSSGQPVYCKFHYETKTNKYLESDEAACIVSKSPDYAIEDLYEAIDNDEYPTWTLYIQVMTFEQAEKSPYNPFDITKVWFKGDYPPIQVGKLVLDKNPTNYFADVEQIAFSPAHLVPGIEPSPDKMLIGRMFSYGDTHRHRLGANYLQLPVNCPYSVKNYQRDGPQTFNNQGGGPNYYPNSFDGPDVLPKSKTPQVPWKITGDVKRYDTGDEDNFSHGRALYQRVFDDAARERFIANLCDSLRDIASTKIRQRAIENFAKVDSSLEKRIVDCLARKT